jgi:hypothetical protein
MLAGVLIDEALEVLFQLACDFGRSTGARAISQAQHALVGKAVDPCAESGRGQVQRVRDRLEPLAGNDGTDCLGTAERPGLFRLLSEGIEGG